jgi:hypothetical protein
MATLHSERYWKVKIYPDDHAPPHFHVQTTDGESLVQIEGLVVLGKGAEKQPCFGQEHIPPIFGVSGTNKTGGTDS